jgi:hypothetical protein
LCRHRKSHLRPARRKSYACTSVGVFRCISLFYSQASPRGGLRPPLRFARPPLRGCSAAPPPSGLVLLWPRRLRRLGVAAAGPPQGPRRLSARRRIPAPPGGPAGAPASWPLGGYAPPKKLGRFPRPPAAGGGHPARRWRAFRGRKQGTNFFAVRQKFFFLQIPAAGLADSKFRHLPATPD